MHERLPQVDKAPFDVTSPRDEGECRESRVTHTLLKSSQHIYRLLGTRVSDEESNTGSNSRTD